MISSSDWVRLRVFETELQVLELKNKKPKVRQWLESEIKKLKEKLDAS